MNSQSEYLWNYPHIDSIMKHITQEIVEQWIQNKKKLINHASTKGPRGNRGLIILMISKFPKLTKNAINDGLWKLPTVKEYAEFMSLYPYMFSSNI